jgi:predicted DNA-binding protein (MmcQ/YjbR family)
VTSSHDTNVHDPNRPPTPGEVKILERLRPICARLPEVVEERDGFGHFSFRVGKRSFVIVGAGEDGSGSMSIKADLYTQDRLIRSGGYVRTPYIGQHGWASLAAGSSPDWAELEELVTDAWRLAAPKRLAKQLDTG